MNKKKDLEMKDEYDFSQGIRGRFCIRNKESQTLRLDESKMPQKNKQWSDSDVNR